MLVPTDELTDLLEGDVTASPAPARVALADGSDTIALPQGIGHEPEPQATPEAPPPTRPEPATPRPAAQPVATAVAPVPRPAAVPRQVQLVFAGVPGYQQVDALEQAVNDLAPGNGQVEVEEFEQGRLVLTAAIADLPTLARQLVASLPSIELDSAAGDRATFRHV